MIKTRWYLALVVVSVILVASLALGCSGTTTTVTQTAPGATVTTTVSGSGTGATVTQITTKTVTETVRGTTTPSGPPIKMKFACAWPVTMGTAGAMKWAGDRITVLTNGQVQFEYFWGGSLTAAYEELKAVETGVVDLTLAHQLYYPDIFPMTYWSWAVAFTPDDSRAAVTLEMRLLSEFPEIQKEVSGVKNGKTFYENTNGPYGFIGRFPINDVTTDLKGKKIIVSGKWEPKWWEALGAQTGPAVTTEIYSLLQTRAVEGAIGPVNGIIAQKWYETGAKYLTYHNFGARTGGWQVMNLDRWNSLPPNIQKIFEQVMYEAAFKSADLVDELNATAEAAGKQAGMVVNTLTQEQKAKWATLIKPYVLEWAKSLDDKGLPGTRVLKRMQEISADLGYPMPVKYVE